MKYWFLILVMCVLIGFIFAANELQFGYATGQNTYGRLWKASTLEQWDTAISDFNDNPAWTDAAIDFTEDANNPNTYVADMPAGSPAGLYRVHMYLGTAATAASTDPYLGLFDYPHNGSEEVSLSEIKTIADNWLIGGGSL